MHVEHAEASSVALLVAPAARGRGVARSVLALLLEGELAGRTLCLTAEPDHVASRRLLLGAGLVESGVDRDGFVEYTRPR